MDQYVSQLSVVHVLMEKLLHQLYPTVSVNVKEMEEVILANATSISSLLQFPNHQMSYCTIISISKTNINKLFIQ